ncbi:MAG: cobyrinate a,c-diamide synthase [Nocardioidaceae bacterium]|nr:cobyrinate a,c-diamide synthase [Nocardioidaceae bacterium]
MSPLPRVILAAPATGQGKTTVATGLMAALAATGRAVSGHKVGPDYIDPGYHSLACARPGRNLDPHLVGEAMIAPLLLHGAAHPTPADIAVIEGVMGLYDGRIAGNGFSSTAHVAALTRTPVVLVVDISASSRSIGALVHGMATWDPSVEVVGVILNQAGSPRHVEEVRASISLPVLGAIPRDPSIATPSRHLGLVTAAERGGAEEVVTRLAEVITEHVDLDAVVALAAAAPALDAAAWSPNAPALTDVPSAPATAPTGPVVAVAAGRAFTFHYAETTELLSAHGLAVVEFDPAHDTALPAGTAGLYLGGGFPERHAGDLAANAAMLGQVREAVGDGLPTVAECGGLLYLCRSLDGATMAGVIEADATMSQRLTLRYPVATSPADTLLTRAGEQVTGHEFHRTSISPAHGPVPAWSIDGDTVGFASPTLHASYLHTHWAGHPQLAHRFAAAVHHYG